jgi:hypothetical protein
MNRQEYNACISSGMKGKQLSKEERRLEFCIVAKTCSGKAKNREEAMLICSQPKEPKAVKAAKRSGKSCEKGAVELAQCVMGYLEDSEIYKQVMNINSAGAAIADALMECQCDSQSKSR